jgi:hypothetical protein
MEKYYLKYILASILISALIIGCRINPDVSVFYGRIKVHATKITSGLGFKYVSASSFFNGNTAIVYSDGSKLRYTIISKDGGVILPETDLDGAIPSAISTTTMKNGNVLVAFLGSSGEKKFLIINSSGTVLIPASSFTSSSVYNLWLSCSSLANGNVIIVYNNATITNAYCSIISQSGTIISSDVLLGTSGSSPFFSSAGMPGDNIAIAYGQFNYTRVIGSGGNLISDNTTGFSAENYYYTKMKYINSRLFIAGINGTTTNDRYGRIAVTDTLGNKISENIYSTYTNYFSLAVLKNSNVLLFYNYYGGGGFINIYDGNATLVSGPTEVVSTNMTSDLCAVTIYDGKVLLAYNNSDYGYFIILE